METPKLPIVLLCGVPECGIHLLNELMMGMPLLHSGVWLNQWEENVQNSLKSLKPGEFRAGYVYYSGELKRFMDVQQIRRFFIYRDPRDMILTYLRYVIGGESGHPYYQYFTQHFKSTEERLLKLITGFHETRAVSRQYGLDAIGHGNINHHYIRYLRWLKDPNTCNVRYEDLLEGETSLRKEINRMMDYLWDNFHQTDIKKADYLKQVHEIQISQVFQQATSGEWQQYFTDEIKSKFKEVGGELLIYLGYEQDMNW